MSLPAAGISVAAAVGVAAVAALGGGAWRWRRGRGGTMVRSRDEALAMVQAARPDFGAVDAVVSSDGRAALLIDGAGRIALLLARGRRPSALDVPWSALRQTFEGIMIDTGRRGVGTVTLRDVDALDIRRLGREPL